MSLSSDQRDFALAVGHFLVWINTYTPYEVTLGDAFRDPRVFGDYGEKEGYGLDKSKHKLRLAIDLNVWKDGKYTKNKEDYRAIGMYWEQQFDGIWGGRFGIKKEVYDKEIGWDANHFEWKR